MAKFFTFADRVIPVQFFDEDPISVTLVASDKTDAQIMHSGELIQQGDRQSKVEARMEKYREAVDLLIGAEKTEEILNRTQEPDGYSILSVYQYLLTCYREGKVKNLTASATR